MQYTVQNLKTNNTLSFETKDNAVEYIRSQITPFNGVTVEDFILIDSLNEVVEYNLTFPTVARI